jgi:hypothetical protein
MTVDEQEKHYDRLFGAAFAGDTQTILLLLAGGADVHVEDDWVLIWAASPGRTETVKVLLASGVNAHAWDDDALRQAVCAGHMETLQILAAHIFAPDAWRGRSRAEIETQANALYDKIKGDNPAPERLHQAGTILADCALTCWEQIRPAPPKIQISPFPAQPRPL